jgi:eukaryotic-like serine/threonine-protein kinase
MIGEKLGNYTILEIVGSGSMGTVYRAEDPEGRHVALKLVRSQILYSMEKRERFLQCLLIASEIGHPAVCPILEIGDDNDDFFVIMPFIQGKTLEQYMEKKPVPFSRSCKIAMGTGSALEAIHAAGAVHRSVKPANIWILDDHDSGVLLTDCCIGRFTEIAKREKDRSCNFGVDFADTLIPLGALAYMSPEQVRGEPVDFRSDIFSFGVVLYQMFSGRHPFEAHNSLSRINAILEGEPAPLSVHHDSVLPQIESIIGKAMAKKREDRYPSVSALLSDIDSTRRSAADSEQAFSGRSGIQRWISLALRRSLRK